MRLLLPLKSMAVAEEDTHLPIHQVHLPRMGTALDIILPTTAIIQNSGKDTMRNHRLDHFQKKMGSQFLPRPKRLAENMIWMSVGLPKSCPQDLPFNLRNPKRPSFEDLHHPFNHLLVHFLEPREALECWILHRRPCKTFLPWDHSTTIMENSTWTILPLCCPTMLPIQPFWICKILHVARYPKDLHSRNSWRPHLPLI